MYEIWWPIFGLFWAIVRVSILHDPMMEIVQEAKEGTYKEIYKGINRRKNLNVNNYEDGLTMAKNSRYAYIAEKSYLDIKGNW